MDKENSVWKILGLALVYTLPVTMAGLVIVTLVGALDDVITKVQSEGHWWLVFIGGYVLSFIYLLYKPAFLQIFKNEK